MANVKWIANKITYLEEREETGKYAEKNTERNVRTANTLQGILDSDFDDETKQFLANLVNKYHFNEGGLRDAYHTRTRR